MSPTQMLPASETLTASSTHEDGGAGHLDGFAVLQGYSTPPRSGYSTPPPRETMTPDRPRGPSDRVSIMVDEIIVVNLRGKQVYHFTGQNLSLSDIFFQIAKRHENDFDLVSQEGEVLNRSKSVVYDTYLTIVDRQRQDIPVFPF